MSVILASASPRRKELLRNLLDDFVIVPSGAEEIFMGDDPKSIVESLARSKAQWVAEKNPDAVVIGADTMVFCGGEPMGKPKNAEEARRMLEMLSGREHEVYTGVAVISPEGVFADAECTKVRFAAMSQEEIEGYIATKDCYDKAGAYGIQGYASRFIEGIDGDYFNVVGLPLRLTYLLLQKANIMYKIKRPVFTGLFCMCYFTLS